MTVYERAALLILIQVYKRKYGTNPRGLNSPSKNPVHSQKHTGIAVIAIPESQGDYASIGG